MHPAQSIPDKALLSDILTSEAAVWEQGLARGQGPQPEKAESRDQ